MCCTCREHRQDAISLRGHDPQAHCEDHCSIRCDGSFAGIGGAYAYWTVTGSADTGTNVPVTTFQTSAPAGLYPGGPAQPLSGNFDNLNPGNTYVTAVIATGYTIDAGHPAATAWATGQA